MGMLKVPMMKFFAPFALCIATFVAHAEVLPSDATYPRLSGVQSSAIPAMILSRPPVNERQYVTIVSAVNKAASQRPLSDAEAEVVRAALADLHRYQVREQDRAAEAEAERVAEVARQQRERQTANEERAARLAEYQATERASHYRRDYDQISSPETAREFIKTYANEDPANLVPGALKKGYAAGIKEQERCIAFANDMIANQKEIGATVGYVDKSAIYQAGQMLVSCRRRLASYKSTAPK